jgi:hypothetical protein
MATIVVHGTMTVMAAQHTRWWWNSWGEGGFLNAVAHGLVDAAGGQDLWRVGGKPVSEVATLNPTWSLWSGRFGQFGQHQGHFMWDGADQGISRDAAASNLVKYLNTLHGVAPNETVRIIAHSHGCNVVKLASADKKLLPTIHFKQVAFLACPHFAGVDGKTFTYRLAPARFGAVLNLYSRNDSVQTSYAENFLGLPGPRLADWTPSRSFRTEQDVTSRAVYQDFEIPTLDSGKSAHTAMHGIVVGYLVGRWFGLGGNFRLMLEQLGRGVLPVPKGDYGE